MSLSSIRMIVLEPGSDRIFTCDGNGENITILRNDARKFPDGLVIDPATREIYGTQMGKVDPTDASAYGFDGEIWRMAADGTNAQPLIGHGAISTPKQITADFTNRKLYWCDREGMPTQFEASQTLFDIST